MNIQDIFDHLAYGELSQLALGGREIDNDGSVCGIHEDDKPAILSHIQMGLTALYSRFRLLERNVTLVLQPNINRYALHSKHSQANPVTGEIAYLDDHEDPFDDRILKVERVFTEDGKQIELNLRDAPYSIRTPTENTLQIPQMLWNYREVTSGGLQETVGSGQFSFPYGANYTGPMVTESPLIDSGETLATKGVTNAPTRLLLPEELPRLLVVYRANHRRIQETPEAFAATTVDLPESYLPALLYYIAARIMNPIGMTNEFHAGNSYAIKYEQECQRITMENYQIDNIGVDDRFAMRGFV